MPLLYQKNSNHYVINY